MNANAQNNGHRNVNNTCDSVRMPTLDQRRAKFAWEAVQDCGKDYMVLAKGAGALIMSNGLMATLAFYESKGKPHHKDLNRHIILWLGQQNKITGVDFKAAMNNMYSGNSADYRAATQESLDLLRWIRQFAAAVVVATDKEDK